MAEYKLTLPPMGEGIIEATLTNWVINEGDYVNEDDTVVEIATDKVDTDVPSPVSGKLIKKLKSINEICKVGEVFAILEIEGNSSADNTSHIKVTSKEEIDVTVPTSNILNELEEPLKNTEKPEPISSTQNQFYSPLIKSICKEENISQQELENVQGSGLNGRITKEDLFNYLKNRISKKENISVSLPNETTISTQSTTTLTVSKSVSIDSGDEIIEMDRMRKLIAGHMLTSKQTSPHVTSFVETDVTNIVLWRNKNKDIFLKKSGEKLTFTPIFVHAIVKAIKDFPMINISVDGTNIIKKKNINIGIATALPNGNLIVPVIKNADLLSLSGLAKTINDLANRARNNQLKPEDIKGGTYTITNIGSFGNIAGTPIINQPEVAIMAVGAITKKPAVIETPQGDLIGIRQKMYLSHTYDHRVVDGALGGMFVKKVSDYLENFDINTEI